MRLPAHIKAYVVGAMKADAAARSATTRRGEYLKELKAYYRTETAVTDDKEELCAVIQAQLDTGRSLRAAYNKFRHFRDMIFHPNRLVAKADKATSTWVRKNERMKAASGAGGKFVFRL